MEIKNSEGPATIFVRSFNFTHPYKFYIILFKIKLYFTTFMISIVKYKAFMRIWYVRVSKEEQNEALQMDALRKHGCDKIFHEKISGISKSRPEYEKVKAILRAGDELVVWDIDRLGRTTLELVMLVDELNQKGILFKSLSQLLIDTTTETGEFVFKLFALLA